VNERIAALAERLDQNTPVFRFLCECVRSDCREVIELTVSDFRKLGAADRRLVVAAHYDPARGGVEGVGSGIYAITDSE
jgi:hypothetical protein